MHYLGNVSQCEHTSDLADSFQSSNLLFNRSCNFLKQSILPLPIFARCLPLISLEACEQVSRRGPDTKRRERNSKFRMYIRDSDTPLPGIISKLAQATLRLKARNARETLLLSRIEILSTIRLFRFLFFSTFSTYTVRCPFPLRFFSFGIILSFRSEKSLGRSRKCSLDMRMDMMRITSGIRIHVLAYNVSARRRIRVRWASTRVSVYVNACVHCGLVQHTSVRHGILEGASLEDRNALPSPATSHRLLQPFSAASRQKIQTFFRVYQLCL